VQVGHAKGLDHANIFALDALADHRSDQAQEHDRLAAMAIYVPASLEKVLAIRNC
jgi:hypothetical protein